MAKFLSGSDRPCNVVVYFSTSAGKPCNMILICYCSQTVGIILNDCAKFNLSFSPQYKSNHECIFSFSDINHTNVFLGESPRQ